MKKVAIIGAGAVGSHICAAGILKNLPAEFLLVDLNENLETGEVLDLRDSLLFSDSKNVSGANFGDEDLKNADIFVITAGVAQKPGETRCELLAKNAKILTAIRKNLGEIKKSAVVILVTNPVDVLTALAAQIFDLPRGNVLGTGTFLDSSRLRWHLAEKSGVHPKSVHGFVLGEHGDSEFVAWSGVRIGGKIPDFSEKEKVEIAEKTRREAYEIIAKKGATFFGIGATTAEIFAAIIADGKKVLPVSAVLRGEFGISEIALGVPAVIGKSGVEKIWEIELSPDEKEKLKNSAEKMRELFRSCPREQKEF